MALVCLAAVIVLLGGCVPRSDEPQSNANRPSPLRLVATFFPVADVVRQVGGERVVVQVLLPPDGELHSFSPTARQMKLLQRADAVFKLGLGAEPFLDAMMRGLGKKRPRVVELAEGCHVLPAVNGHHHHPEHEHHEHEYDTHHDEAIDPHVWLSVANVIQMTRNAETALCELDPSHAAYYKQNADRLISDLKHLQESLTARATTWRHKKFIAAHGAYRYLAEETGLEQVAVFEPMPGVEPSARWLRDLIRTARREGVHVVFTAPPASSRLVEVVARDLNMRVYVLDPLERTLHDPDESYQSRVRRNIQTLDEAMR